MAHYLNDEQHARIRRHLGEATHGEWQTWLVTAMVYGGWLAALLCYDALTLLPSTMILILCCVWYIPLQHKFMHGHPTRHAWFNKMLGYAPLAVWFPYTLYRESHMHHHQDQNLTYLGLDPE